MDYLIHFWEISGYVNINRKSKNRLKQKIISKSSLNKFSNCLSITNMSLYNFLNKNNSFIRIKNFVGILDNLNLNKSDFEKEIILFRDTSSKKAYNLNFPYYFSAIDMRIVGVLFGDGNIHKKNNMARWIQKDVSPLKNLFKNVYGIDMFEHTNNMQITIPAFFIKFASKILFLSPIELASHKIFKSSLKLPKEYRLALLIAVIEDEGNIDVNNYGGILIRISSKEGIYFIKKLSESLNYKTSNITSYANNGSFGKKKMYRLSILSEGIKLLGKDLIEFEKKFGICSSFWKKRNAFFQKWKISNKKIYVSKVF